MSHMIISLT